MKGHKSKSVSFGIVMTNKLDNSIISESSSVDLIDGAKLSTKRKSVTKLPYKNTKVFGYTKTLLLGAHSTVWNLKDFSAFHILREITFGKFGASKNCKLNNHMLIVWKNTSKCDHTQIFS